MGWKEIPWAHSGNESRMYHQELLNSLVIWQTVRSPTGHLLQNWGWAWCGVEFGGGGGEWMSEVCLPVSLAGVGGWGIRMSKEEGWGRIPGSPGDRYNKEWGWVKPSGLLQSWGTTGWLYLQELKEKEVSAVNLWLPGPEPPVESQGGLTEAGGWDKAVSSEREFQEGEIHVIHWRWDRWGEWDCSRQDWEWDGGSDLEELRERGRSAANLPTSLAGVGGGGGEAIFMCYLDIYLAPKPSVLGKSVSALLRMGLLGFRVSLCLLILGERGESEHGW